MIRAGSFLGSFHFLYEKILPEIDFRKYFLFPEIVNSCRLRFLSINSSQLTPSKAQLRAPLNQTRPLESSLFVKMEQRTEYCATLTPSPHNSQV